MNVHRLTSSAMVRAPAKLNLFFEVLGKRSDGFHEVETLMVTIGLYDTLTARLDPSGAIHLDCRWAAPARDSDQAFGRVPSDHTNLAVKAVELLRRRSGTDAGIAMELVKRIPAEAGLGGGSSDAAAALIAANAMWNLGWTRRALADLAAELGSDVPFFVGQDDHRVGCVAAVCRGRGERVEPICLPGPLDFVVVRPPAGLATAQVYRQCQAAREPRSVAPLVTALMSGDRRQMGRLVHNRLQPAAASLSPWVDRLAREFAQEDCLAAQMSGSGSSYFGICRHARHARRVAMRLQARGVGHVVAVSTSN